MKVVALNGSPREKGNTELSLRVMMAILEKEGIETEFIQLGGSTYSGCRACNGCFKKKDKKCVMDNDDMNEIMAKVFDADGIIIGSPSYYSNVTTEVKAFIDRCGYVSMANGGLLKRKVGASVVPARRAGSNFVYSAINFFYGINEMVIPSSTYWNMTLAVKRGDVMQDEEGLRTFETLAENMAWLMKSTQEKK